MFLSCLEIAAGIIVLLTTLTQILVPAFRGTPLFPFLRTEKHLASDLERAHEEVLEEALRNRIEKRRREAERLRQQRHTVGKTGSAEVPQTDDATKTQ